MEYALDRLCGSAQRPQWAATSHMPFDVIEKDNRLWVRAALPGIDPSTVEVTVENGILTIQGTSHSEPTSEGEKIFRREIVTGQLSRSLRIPEGFDLENVEAQSKHGILIISIPKMIEEKPKSLRIPVKVENTETE